MAVNPHYPAGPAMRLFRSERIEQIEATDAFREARAIAERRQAAAQKGLQTRARNAAVVAAENIAPPLLPAAPRGELVAMAVEWFNGVETWRSGAGRWVSVADPEEVLFPIVVDFIRDRLRDYRQRARPIGLPVDQATAAVEQRVLAAIAERFPWLAPICLPRKAESADEVKESDAGSVSAENACHGE